MTQKTAPITIFWLRRDLRLEDNHGLYQALTGAHPVFLVFVFDSIILEALPSRRDRRVSFIHETLSRLSSEVEKLGSAIYSAYGTPLAVFQQLIEQYLVAEVVTNHDFEPYAIERDNAVRELLEANEIRFVTNKDQVIFDPKEVLKPGGSPYTVFTPYSKAWKKKLGLSMPEVFPSEKHLSKLFQHQPLPIPALTDLGFEAIHPCVPKMRLEPDFLKEYANTRNLPYMAGTSHVSTHLRFGTVSIRRLVGLALHWSDAWLNELIWREFFMMVLFHFPRVVHHSFHRKYDKICWRNNKNEFMAWCNGKTGFPLVDAGMRELNATGWMHSRVRMVAASFLTKHLLIDWRWGEAYFAEKLLDYELSSNNGNWQWAAGTGCDAAPYFRVFNPSEQARKFDPENKYIRQWIPETVDEYPVQIVDHKFARERALQVYRKVNEG